MSWKDVLVVCESAFFGLVLVVIDWDMRLRCLHCVVDFDWDLGMDWELGLNFVEP